MAELTPLEIEARRVVSEKLDRTFAGMLRRAILIMHKRAEKAFDGDAHPRHPAGTPVDPETGAGGGWFAPKEGGEISADVGGMVYGASDERVQRSDAAKRLGIEQEIKEIRSGDDITAADVEQYANEVVGELVGGGTVAIRADLEVVDDILREGRYKSLFETNASNGYMNKDFRRMGEMDGMGYPFDAADAERPIYGYIDHPDLNSRVAMYGGIKIALKEGVKERTTITVGDSLEGMANGVMYGVAIDDLGETGTGYMRTAWQFVSYTGSDVPRRTVAGMVANEFSYIEAQVHGGVTVKDIDRVTMDVEFSVLGAAFGYRDDVVALVDAADKAGVPFLVRDRKSKEEITGKELLARYGDAAKAFDADAHPRHPEGTPVDPESGAGGGRFAAKEGTSASRKKPEQKQKRQRWLNEIYNGDGGVDAYNAAIREMYAGFSTYDEGGFDAEKILHNLGYAESATLSHFSEELDRSQDYHSDRATLEKYAERTTKAVAEIVEQNPVAIRVGFLDIDSIIADGRLKTQHETYDSNGAFDLDFRSEVETEVMGISPGDRSYPVYGYVDFGNPPRVGDYGQIKLVLKEDVKNRTTITVGDSLGEYRDGAIFAVPLREASLTPAYLGRKLFPTFKWLETNASTPDDLYTGNLFYIEAQVHGGVALQDVAYVEVLTDSLVGVSDDDEVEALAEKIRGAGLEVRRVAKRGA